MRETAIVTNPSAPAIQASTVAQALDNFAAADKQLSPQVVQSMYDLWKQEIEADPLPW